MDKYVNRGSTVLRRPQRSSCVLYVGKVFTLSHICFWRNEKWREHQRENEVLYLSKTTVYLNPFMYIIWNDFILRLRGCSLIYRGVRHLGGWRARKSTIILLRTVYRYLLRFPLTVMIPWRTFLREMNEDTKSRDHIRSAAGPRFSNSPVRNHHTRSPIPYLHLIHYYDLLLSQ